MKDKKTRLFVGVDVGGTKILSILSDCQGNILARNRCQTPREKQPSACLDAIVELVRGMLNEQGVKPKSIEALGLAIPGVVDPDAGLVVVTPNMNLSGLKIAAMIKRRLGWPVALGNDVNCGILGEKWLGAAREARGAVGIFIGTGIGGGVIVHNRLLRGSRESAGEIGHMIIQPGGPRCGCGNRGCLEALASRTAIERDIRAAMKAGAKTVLASLMDKDDQVIRSSLLRKALKREDELVTKVMHNAATVLGVACLTIRHLLDPDVIVLGGGVIEACGKFLLPIIEKYVQSDPLPGARAGGHIVASQLGDDAVACGAVALALELAGAKPLKKKVAAQ